MTRRTQPRQPTQPPLPLSVLLLWIFGGVSFALIVYLFTPFTHNLDDIKVTLQYVLAPIVWGFFAVALYGGHVRRIHPAIAFSVSGFLLIMLAATILGRFPWRAWHEFGFQLTIMAPFLVVAGTATTERRFRNICLYYFLVGCGTVAFGLFHYFGGVGFLYNMLYADRSPQLYSPLHTLLYTLRQNGDMLSTILNRDFYAAYLVMIAPLGVALALDYESVRAKMFFLLMFFLMALCITLGFSKDSYLAISIMTVVFLVLFAAERDWRVVPRRVLWLWIVGGTAVITTVIVAVRDKLFYNLDWEIWVSIMSRKVIWGGALGIFWDLSRPVGTFLKYIFLGGGPGAFYLAFPLYRDPNYHLYEISNVTLFAHNQYLDLLCEEGILGLTAFLIFLVSVLWFLLREAWNKPRHRLNVYQIALFSSLLGVSIQNIFSPNIRWTVCGFNYWFLLGLAVAAFHLTLDKDQLERIDRFYRFPEKWRRRIAISFVVFALGFEAVSIPYGLIRFNAAKNNNDGLILLTEFGKRCDEILAGKQMGDQSYREIARRLGFDTIDAFRRALKWMPAFITSYYKLAHVYSRMASIVANNIKERMDWWRAAMETYNLLARYAPDYSEIHLNYGILGRVFYSETRKAEDLARSVLAFRRAAKMSNKLVVQNYYWEALQLAVSHVSTSSTEQAQAVACFLSALQEIGRTDEHVRTRLDELEQLVKDGRTSQAASLEVELFRYLAAQVAERMPTLTNVEGGQGERYVQNARRWLMDYYFSRGEYDKALPHIEALLESDPSNTTLLRAWTTAAVRSGQPKRCLELLARLIERNPLNWAARDAAREVLELVGDYRRSLEQSLALAAILYPKDKSLAPARTSQMPSEAEVYFHIGLAAEKTNQLKIAYENYVKAIDADPEGQWGKMAERAYLRVLEKIESKGSAGGSSAKKTGPQPKAASP